MARIRKLAENFVRYYFAYTHTEVMSRRKDTGALHNFTNAICLAFLHSFEFLRSRRRPAFSFTTKTIPRRRCLGMVIVILRKRKREYSFIPDHFFLSFISSFVILSATIQSVYWSFISFPFFYPSPSAFCPICLL